MSIELRAQAAAVCAPYRPWQPVAPQGDDLPPEEQAVGSEADFPHRHPPDSDDESWSTIGRPDESPAAHEAEARPMNGVPAGTERLSSAPPAGLPVFDLLVAESRPGLFDRPPVPPPSDERPAPRHA